MEIDKWEKIRDSFLQELRDALDGKTTSIPFIIHDIPSFSLVKDDEEFQVVVIGGTYGIHARIIKKGKSCEIISQETIPLPTISNREDFLIFLEKLISAESRVVALNFAYPILPVFENGRLDGKLLRGTKGHAFRGLIGKKIGEEVEKYISVNKDQKLIVSAANDTVCLLLSGLEKSTWEKLGAGIVGTGMNFAFYLNENRLVNLESADFNRFTQSETGREIDEESANPGLSTYEKEVAGVYLYKHFNKEIRAKKIRFRSIESTEELDTIAKTENNEIGQIAKSLFLRSAKLIACQVAAIMEFRKTDMTFVMEGSLFWKGYKYRETVEEMVKKLTDHKSAFIEISDSGIIGAAHLVT